MYSRRARGSGYPHSWLVANRGTIISIKYVISVFIRILLRDVDGRMLVYTTLVEKGVWPADTF